MVMDGGILSPVIESGVLSSPAAAGTNVLDAQGKHWPANVFAHFIVEVYEGRGSPQMRVITSNDKNSLVIDGTWETALAKGAKFRIFSYDPKLSGEVTAIKDKLDDPVHGLAALDAEIDAVSSKTDDLQSKLDSLILNAPHIEEFWETEAIDPLVWDRGDPATNPLTVVSGEDPCRGTQVVLFDIEDGEEGELGGIQAWRAYPNIASSHLILKQLFMEWEIYHHDVAHMSQGEGNSFMGFNWGDEFIGFLYDANQLVCASGEIGPRTTLTNVIEDTRNKLKIVIGQGFIKYYVNEILRATHTTEDFEDCMLWPVWHFASAGGGADTFEVYLGGVRIGYKAV